MSAIITLALKDLLLLWRYKAGLFWVIGFPLLMALLFGAIFSSGGGSASSIKIAVVDDDKTGYSKDFIQQLEQSESLKLIHLPLDSAKQRVRKGKAAAYLHLKEGYGESQRFFQMDEANIELGIDPSRRVVAGFLHGLVIQASFKLMQKQFTNTEGLQKRIQASIGSLKNDTNLTTVKRTKLNKFLSSLDQFLGNFDTSIMGNSSPFEGPKIKTVNIASSSNMPRSSYEITFPAAILWALIGCTSTFAVSIVVERTRGTFLRLRIAPLSRAQILAGKGLACFITSITVTIGLLVFGWLVFGVRLSNNPLALIAAGLSSAFCFVGLMMFISVIGKTEQAVGGAGMAILLIMSMTGGGMIPLIAMPKWMLTVSNFSPVKWGILAMEGAIWRNFSFTEMMLPVGILLTIGLVAFSIGVAVFSRSEI
ncbi:MAG: ABC transporter permease [Candidatus Zixiibacteriota bacterium]